MPTTSAIFLQVASKSVGPSRNLDIAIKKLTPAIVAGFLPSSTALDTKFLAIYIAAYLTECFKLSLSALASTISAGIILVSNLAKIGSFLSFL